MSASQIQTCSLLLKEEFGETLAKVGEYLMKKGATPLRVLAHETSFKLDLVRKALCTLIMHNMVTFDLNKRGFIEYKIQIKGVQLLSRSPRYIYTAKTLYGDEAELIVEEMLTQGQVLMSKVIKRVTDRLNEALEGNGGKPVTAKVVQDKFTKLAQTHFIQRCAAPPSDDGEEVPKAAIPQLSISEEELYLIPDIDSNGGSRKRKRSGGDSSQPAKKRKVDEDNSQDDPDCGIYWHVNFDRFHHHFRDQAIISAVASKFDRRAADIVRAMFRLAEVRSEPTAPVSNPMSSHEIHQALPSELGISKQHMDQYLSLLSDDSSEFISKVGESGGGMFCTNIKKAMTTLCKAHIESVVQERFGSKCFRIFRLLLLKQHLEHKQIEEYAMIPAKEAKDLLYRMITEHFVTFTEIAKTPDHAPARTFYLFSVDLKQLSRMLLETCYKSQSNLMLRREHETKENKRLLEKHQRVEAITATLELSGADPAQKQEIEEMITPPERQQLTKVKHMTNKLDQSELQVDETISVLETYLIYCLQT